MEAEVQIVQSTGPSSIDNIVTMQMKLGWALYGSPFVYGGRAAQIMTRGTDVPAGETGDYRIVMKDGMASMQHQLTFMALHGWELYGNTFQVYGQSAQAMVKGFVPIQHGAGQGGGTPDNPGIKQTGYFDYQNSVYPQKTVSGVWSNLLNTGEGPYTQTAFAPPGVTNMLERNTGRLLLNELSIGDQVDVQYTLDAMGYSNGVDMVFRHLAGQEGQQYYLGLGSTVRMQSGAGVQTGPFVINGSFIIRDDNTRLGGVTPQIKTAGVADVTYTGAYIRVTRNSLT